MENTSSSPSPQLEKATLTGIRYSKPNPPYGRGYNVLNLEKDNKKCTALQPFEEWKIPSKIEQLIGEEIVITKNFFGEYRVHENMQKDIFNKVNSLKKDLKHLSDTDEILAMGIEISNTGIRENSEKLQQLINYILAVLTRLEAIEKSVIMTDNDLFNLQQVLINSGINSNFPFNNSDNLAKEDIHEKINPITPELNVYSESNDNRDKSFFKKEIKPGLSIKYFLNLLNFPF